LEIIIIRNTRIDIFYNLIGSKDDTEKKDTFI